jgi:hypothetical protein
MSLSIVRIARGYSRSWAPGWQALVPRTIACRTVASGTGTPVKGVD